MNNKVFSNIRATLFMNQAIFYLRKIPFLKDVIGPYAYYNDDLKKTLATVAQVVLFIISVAKKAAYLAILMLLANTVPLAIFNDTALSFVVYFAAFNFFTIANTRILEDSKTKWLLITLFKTPSDDYYDYALKQRSYDRLFLGIMASILTGISLWPDLQAMSLLMMLLILIISLHTVFLGETMMIHYFNQHNRKMRMRYELMVSLLFGAIPMALLLIPTALNWVYGLISFGLIVSLYVCYRYTLQNANPSAVNRFMTQNMTLSTETSQKVKELTQEELRIDDLNVNQTTELSHRYSGYKLLNIAFFMRHRRMWFKPLIGMLRIITAFVVGGVVIKMGSVYLFGPNFFETIIGSNSSLISQFMLIFYFLNVTKKITRACFLNADYSLLHYAFYRRKETIWKQYLSRLGILIVINFVPVIAVLLGLILWNMVGLLSFELANFIPLCVSLLSLSALYTTVHLFLYYILQPYNRDMEVKSITYHIAEFAIIIFVYSNNMVASLASADIVITVFSIIVIIISTVLVRLFAHKTFKLREH
ncbi:hypothetical protein [Erysipelothrix anatis]|uniref:hypothetical protein n=1 Tax=Erysipelothrix anatis TaxID=2683713 RepID=UPI00140CDC2E|nr:hypothetical protein [Erysipelothrix anatis]